jgi:putative membrane protein
MMHYGFGWVGAIFGGLLMLLFLVGIVVLIVWLVRSMGRAAWMSGRGPAAGPEKTPLDILKERYARGEVTRDEYEAMRQDLSK